MTAKGADHAAGTGFEPGSFLKKRIGSDDLISPKAVVRELRADQPQGRAEANPSGGIREAAAKQVKPLAKEDALIVAIASVADVIVTKLAKQNADSMAAVCKAIEANGKAMRECLDEIRGALTKDAEADSAVLDRLAKSIDKLKIPAATVKNDVRHDGIAEAMASVASAVERVGKMVAASNEKVIAAIASAEKRELKVEMQPAPAKEAGGHQFTIERDNDGNMKTVRAIPIKPHPIRGYS